MQNPRKILDKAYKEAKIKPIQKILSSLSSDCVQDLRTIIEKAESQKGVLGVVLTSIVYKIYNPKQDIRYHQEKSMPGGYSGRTFDTKNITPFIREKFSHYAMAESAWLTRSLEQPHPYTLDYPGKIRDVELKKAFLKILDYLQKNEKLSYKILTALIALLIEIMPSVNTPYANIKSESELSIAKIIEVIKHHIYYSYDNGVVGTARIPVLAIYSVYGLLMPEIKRYENKILAPLQTHTSSDSRSGLLGDIDINNVDGSCFESIEIKHRKPVTADMIDIVFRKIKGLEINRYYILTTNEPNVLDNELVMQKLEEIKGMHSCQIIINGVIPSLKYYLRLISKPQDFVNKYTELLESEYKRGSGIKEVHLKVWREIRNDILNLS